jgi:hypothetical protein
MAIENKQIRWVWGVLVSIPVVLKNKMIGFNVGDNGSGRDRTQMIARDPNGDEHTFITVEEIQDYIDVELNSFNSGSVYVLVTSLAEFKTASESFGNFTIYCNDGAGYGITITDSIIDNIAPVGIKRVIGNNGVAFNMLASAAVPVTEWEFTVATGAELNIEGQIRLETYGTSYTAIDNDGDGIMRVSEVLDVSIGTTSNFLLFHFAGNPLKFLIECNNTSYDINTTTASFAIWSGKYTQTKEKLYEVTNGSEKNTIVRVDQDIGIGPSGIFTKVVCETNRTATPGLSKSYLRFISETLGVDTEFTQIEFNRGSQNGSLPAYVSFRVDNGAASLTRVLTLYGDGAVEMPGLKSGPSQGLAGASVNELWRDTADNTVKIGV